MEDPATRYDAFVFLTRKPVATFVRIPQTTVGRNRSDVWRGLRCWISWKLETSHQLKITGESSWVWDVLKCGEIPKWIKSSPCEEDGNTTTCEGSILPDGVRDYCRSSGIFLSLHPVDEYGEKNYCN